METRARTLLRLQAVRRVHLVASICVYLLLFVLTVIVGVVGGPPVLMGRSTVITVPCAWAPLTGCVLSVGATIPDTSQLNQLLIVTVRVGVHLCGWCQGVMPATLHHHHTQAEIGVPSPYSNREVSAAVGYSVVVTGIEPGTGVVVLDTVDDDMDVASSNPTMIGRMHTLYVPLFCARERLDRLFCVFDAYERPLCHGTQ